MRFAIPLAVVLLAGAAPAGLGRDGGEAGPDGLRRELQEIVLSTPDDGFAITERVNRLLSRGRAAVVPVLGELLRKAGKFGTPASDYRGKVESLAAILGGSDYEPPPWLRQSVFVVRYGVVLIEGRPPPGFWHGQGFSWRPPPALDEILGGEAAWRAPLKPDRPALLEAFLGTEDGPDAEASRGSPADFAVVVGQAARTDPAIAKALLEATAEPAGYSALRCRLWGALSEWGTEEALARLERDLRYVLGRMAKAHEGEIYQLRILTRAIRGAGGPAALFRIRERLEGGPEDVRNCFDGLVEGNVHLAQQLDAIRGDPSALNFRRLRYALAWSGHLAPTLDAYFAGLRVLRDLAGTGPPEVRTRALRLLDEALLEQPWSRMAVHGPGEKTVPLDGVADEYRPLDQLARLEGDLATGAVRLTDWSPGRWDLFSDVLRIEDLPPGWRQTPDPVAIRLGRSGRSLTLRIENTGDAPVAVNPTAFRYGRARLWECERGEDDERREWRELHLGLGSIVSTYVPHRLEIPASALAVIAPGQAWETGIVMPAGAPEAVLLDYYDAFAVSGPLPAPLLVEFHARID